MNGTSTQNLLKKSGTIISTMNSLKEKKVIGTITKVCLLTLLGAHYMYLQWTKIDVGAAEFRESNRLFFIFWEACKADSRSYGMCYLKNRRSGFSFMASADTVNQATISRDSRYGILSKSGADAKKMFTDKVVPISINYPFFFKPIQDGMERPKTELSYKVPSRRLTRNSRQGYVDRGDRWTRYDDRLEEHRRQLV